MGEIVVPPLSHVLLFMLAVLVVTSFVITVAGQFPAEHRNPALAGVGGGLLLWTTIAVAALVGAGAIIYAWFMLPWYVAVIGAGLMILIAPYVLHPLPNRIINGRSALLVLAALALLVGGGMWVSAGEGLL